ncbi:MAG: ATP-binding protein [Firmicutes bacterium]|nr:ATP-binding protein [Bacillota bacterium]
MDDDNIIDYIGNILDLAPIKLTEQCHELLFKNIYEVFNNASDHSRSCQGVYACGHWMPTKKQLVFSVYDTGIGIPSLVKEEINENMSSHDAINWALQRGNSTKQLIHGIPRGLGLSDLYDFIRLNDGALNIFTNDIYFEYKKGNTSYELLSFPIIGTFIGITIKADYNHIYTTR